MGEGSGWHLRVCQLPAPAPLKVAEMKGSVKPTARKNPLKKLALMGSKGKADPLPPSGYEWGETF